MTTVRERVLAGAQRWLGTPYLWGGESEAEGGVDCSGLIIAAFKAAGVPLPGRPIASELGKMGTPVPLAQAQPGDVVYYDKPGRTDHVGIYLGGNKMINAPYAGTNVRVDSVGTPTSVRRLLPEEGGGAGGGGVSVEAITTGIGLGVGTFFGGMSGNASGGASAGIEAGSAVGSVFGDWGGTATKLVVTGVAGALVVIGLTHTVSK